ncbi:uncharacterized protein LOC121822864 isoform X4 [Peromyscus maniculatus bairdii]|uniref:uncharacterized protein LOC121822864 isoform X4 n=1 Tax=Peromyscus maniculatus bairdii TaxID=230844 RepID=UPI003FD288ED
MRKNSLACTPALSLFFPPRMFFKAKDQEVSSLLLLQCHACCLLPTTMIMDSHPLKLNKNLKTAVSHQARLPVEGLGYQLSHITIDLQSVLPEDVLG